MSYSIEILRVISIFFIIVFHTKPIIGMPFFHSGLIFFVCVSVYLCVNKRHQGAFLLNHFKRLIIPWLIWCFIYALGNKAVKGYFFTANDFDFFTILKGSKVHLWYLPFMFMVLVIISSLKKSDYSSGFNFGSLIYIFMMVTAYAWWPLSLGLPEPLPQYLHALPAVFASLGLSKSKKNNFVVTIIMLLTSTLFAIKFTAIFVPYTIGLIMFSFVLFFPFVSEKQYKWIDLFSKQSMGIYLVHPLFIYLLGGIKVIVGLFFPVLVFFCSFLLIIILKRLMIYADNVFNTKRFNV